MHSLTNHAWNVLKGIHSRKNTTVGGEGFRRAFRRRHPSMSVRYPTELSDLPKFASWLTARVKSSRESGAHVDDDVLQYGQPPERYAISHRKMYAFSMHFRVRSAEGGLVTCDSCVVGTFTRQMPWGLRNGRPMERTDEYVGYIDEILELDYRNHCTTFSYAIGFNRAMIPGIQTSEEITMASLLRTSTAWMARCTPTRLRSLCIVNKYFSPAILQGRGGRLYVGQTSGADAINWNSTSPCRPLLKWEMMVSLRVCNHGWRM